MVSEYNSHLFSKGFHHNSEMNGAYVLEDPY